MIRNGKVKNKRSEYADTHCSGSDGLTHALWALESGFKPHNELVDVNPLTNNKIK
jgi:hypothetical protein